MLSIMYDLRCLQFCMPFYCWWELRYWIFGFHRRKWVLLVQSLLTFVLIFTSGAVIPTLYFPLVVQRMLPYFFSYDSLNWMMDIVLEGRNYADFTSLIIAAVVGMLSSGYQRLEKRGGADDNDYVYSLDALA